MRARPAALPWPRRPAARVLAGARAVGTLRRSLARHAAHALGLRRFAGWLRELTAPPPSLGQDEPLGILPALVGDTTRPAAGENGRTVRPAPGEPSDRRKRRQRVGARDRGRERREGAVTRPADTDARRRPDDGESLALRGPPAPALPRAAIVVRHPLPAPAPGAPAGGRALSAPPAQGRRSRRARSAARSAPRRPPAAFADVLAARAARQFVLAVDAAAAAATVAGPAATLAQQHASTDSDGAPAAALLVRTVLASQWTMPVTGRSAPADLLWRLVADPATGPASVTPVRAQGPPTWVPAGAAQAPVAASRGVPADGAPSATAPPHVDASPPPPLESASPGASTERVRGLAADLPARGLGARAEAATRLRLPAAQDIRPLEDLDALAENVKRILDSEARRHGIDV